MTQQERLIRLFEIFEKEPNWYNEAKELIKGLNQEYLDELYNFITKEKANDNKRKN